MDPEAIDTSNNKATAAAAQRRSDRWLLPDNFLRTKRMFYNAETDQIDRTALRYFAPSSAQLFDAAYSTLVMQHRLYKALSERWAERHPLLDHEVHLARVQQLFREFSKYSIKLLQKIYVDTFRPDRQLGRVLIERPKKESNTDRSSVSDSDDIRANVISKRTFDALRETLERERKEAARLHTENEQLTEELETLNDESIVLDEKSNTAMLNKDYNAHNYLRYLISSKNMRRRIIQNELADLLKFAGPSNVDSTARSRERALARAMIVALNEILKLNRILNASTTNPLTELDKESRVDLVVPKTINLFGRNAESLMKLYNEIYIQLTELEAKRAMDREKTQQSSPL